MALVLASDSIPEQQPQPHYLVVSHDVYQRHPLEPQPNHVPPRLIQVELTICFEIVSHYDTMTGHYSVSSSSHHTLRFPLFVLRDRLIFHRLLDLAFTEVGMINTSSSLASYDVIVQEITAFGIGIANATVLNRTGFYYQTLFLQSVIQAVQVDSVTWMTRALAESALELESNNYGMVAAAKSSIIEMLKRVGIKEEEEEECTICLDEFEVGLEATQMPCSHSFHDNCIRKWLNQSHYCPVCRFEMPTETD